MAEKEYIERENALWLVYSGKIITGDNSDKSARELIESIPAADVRSVVRGKWIDHQEGRWIYAKCSECGTVHDVKSNFCPNCGCAMEET